MCRIKCFFKVYEIGVQSCIPLVDLFQYISESKNLIDGTSVPRKPACSFLKMLSTPFLILLINALPKILFMTGESVIPLQFVHSSKLPFLGTLLSVLCSSFSVLRPLPQLCWTTSANSFVFSFKSVFRSSATTLSCPAASHFPWMLLHFWPLLV